MLLGNSCPPALENHASMCEGMNRVVSFFIVIAVAGAMSLWAIHIAFRPPPARGLTYFTKIIYVTGGGE